MEISEIFRNSLGLEVLNIEDNSIGLSQEVKIVTTSQQKYVFKTSKKGNPIQRSRLAYDKFSDLIKMPKLILTTDEFLIEEYIEGQPLNTLSCAEGEFRHLYSTLGTTIRTIHSAEIGDSTLVSRLYFNSNFPGKLQELEQLNHFPKDTMQGIIRYFTENQPRQTDLVLVHGDISDDHVLIKDNQICGIIDWGAFGTDLPEYEFTRMYLDHHDDYKFKALLEGYGSAIDLGAVRYFAARRIIERLVRYSHSNQLSSKSKRLETLLSDILRNRPASSGSSRTQALSMKPSNA